MKRFFRRTEQNDVYFRNYRRSWPKAGLLNKPTNEWTNEEIKIAENVPLDVFVVRHPEIYEKIRDAVYKNFQDTDGFYFN